MGPGPISRASTGGNASADADTLSEWYSWPQCGPSALSEEVLIFLNSYENQSIEFAGIFCNSDIMNGGR